MIELKLDTNDIETELHTLIKTVYDGEVYCGNRPQIIEDKDLSFIVVKAASGGNNTIANDRVISSKKVCSVQIWTRDVSVGMKNMQLESQIRTLVITLLPAIAGSYKFTYMNDIGSRDLLGFHGKYINLNVYII